MGSIHFADLLLRGSMCNAQRRQMTRQTETNLIKTASVWAVMSCTGSNIMAMGNLTSQPTDGVDITTLVIHVTGQACDA